MCMRRQLFSQAWFDISLPCQCLVSDECALTMESYWRGSSLHCQFEEKRSTDRQESTLVFRRPHFHGLMSIWLVRYETKSNHHKVLASVYHTFPQIAFLVCFLCLSLNSHSIRQNPRRPPHEHNTVVPAASNAESSTASSSFCVKPATFWPATAISHERTFTMSSRSTQHIQDCSLSFFNRGYWSGFQSPSSDSSLNILDPEPYLHAQT